MNSPGLSRGLSDCGRVKRRNGGGQQPPKVTFFLDTRIHTCQKILATQGKLLFAPSEYMDLMLIYARHKVIKGAQILLGA